MRHPEDVQLNDFLDGLLPPAEARVVTDHLAACPACAARVAALGRVTAALAALPRDIQPRRDLRPHRHALEPTGDAPVAGVEGPRRITPFRAGWLRAAAVAALLAGGAVVGQWVLRQSAATAVIPAPVAAASYAAADGELRALVAAEAGRMSPAARQLLDANLASLDRAIQELETARAAEPENHRLSRMLTERYEARLELLRSAAAMLAEG